MICFLELAVQSIFPAGSIWILKFFWLIRKYVYPSLLRTSNQHIHMKELPSNETIRGITLSRPIHRESARKLLFWEPALQPPYAIWDIEFTNRQARTPESKPPTKHASAALLK